MSKEFKNKLSTFWSDPLRKKTPHWVYVFKKELVGFEPEIEFYVKNGSLIEIPGSDVIIVLGNPKNFIDSPTIKEIKQYTHEELKDMFSYMGELFRKCSDNMAVFEFLNKREPWLIKQTVVNESLNLMIANAQRYIVVDLYSFYKTFEFESNRIQIFLLLEERPDLVQLLASKIFDKSPEMFVDEYFYKRHVEVQKERFKKLFPNSSITNIDPNDFKLVMKQVRSNIDINDINIRHFLAHYHENMVKEDKRMFTNIDPDKIILRFKNNQEIFRELYSLFFDTGYGMTAYVPEVLESNFKRIMAIWFYPEKD